MKLHLPHLESNVTSACQLRCVSCNHLVALDAVAKPKPFMMDEDVFQRDLENFSRLATVEKFGFLGGEPLLHPRLVNLIFIAKASGIAKELEVWTNGLRVTAMTDQFWLAPFDTLVVSAYPGHVNDDMLDSIRLRCHQWGKTLVLKDERLNPNFTQLLKTSPGNAQATYDQCWFRTFSRVLDNGFLYQCCCGPYVPRLLLGLPEGTDGLAITTTTTVSDVASYLNRREALASCSPCAGRNTADAVPVPWEEIRDPKLWLERSSGR